MDYLPVIKFCCPALLGEKILLLLPEDLERVTFQVAFLIQMIQNGSNFFCDVASFFSQTEPHAGGSMEKEESDKEDAAEEAVDLCSENSDKIENEKK